jgi:hypothetical protein
VLAVVIASALAIAVAAPSPPADDAGRVDLVAGPQDDVHVPTTVVDELRDGDVLRVFVTGGLPDAGGSVAQCRITVDRAIRCHNYFPVRFGPAGEAAFQYRLRDSGQCGANGACAVVVRDDEGERIATAWTVFGAAAPPAPVVRLTPDGPLPPGGEVLVEVTGTTPESRLTVAICGERCGPTVSLVTDEDGIATARAHVPEQCSRCRLVVAGAANSTVMPVALTTPPGPRYEAGRMAAGLVAAVLLLLTAWRLAATTDWRPPSEADVPEWP